MEQQLRSFMGESKCIILVDEIMETKELGDFADQVRSEVCMWMDEGLCNAVLFSTSDVNFMIRGITPSGRAVCAVTTLQLLNLTESILFLNGSIEAAFVDGEGNSAKTVVRQLALASGGHHAQSSLLSMILSNR
jgi:hypothetical protein